MLTSAMRQSLTSVLTSRLSFPINTAMVTPYVGAAIAHGMPALPTLSTVAAWMIDEALSQPTPDILLRMIRGIEDAAIGGKMDALLALADRLEDAPSLWQPAAH